MFSYLFALLGCIVCSTVSASEVNRVIIVGCDGMGQIYIDNATHLLPNIGYLFKNGAYFGTGYGRNQLPTVSAPNWNTILTGQPPEMSGVISNEWIPNQKANYTNGYVTSATNSTIPEAVWSLIKSQRSELSTAVLLSWEWPKYLVNDNVDYLFLGNENDTAVMDKVLQIVEGGEYNFTFIHLNDIDEHGHKYGWGSKEYYSAVANVDHFIGDLIKMVREGDVLIVTADHGGWRKHHDYRIEASLFVPAIFYGSMINSGVIDSYYNHIDMVPTVLSLFGLNSNPTKYVRGVAHSFHLVK